MCFILGSTQWPKTLCDSLNTVSYVTDKDKSIKMQILGEMFKEKPCVWILCWDNAYGYWTEIKRLDLSNAKD